MGYDRDETNDIRLKRGYKGPSQKPVVNYVIDGFNAKITALWYVDTDHESTDGADEVDKNDSYVGYAVPVVI